MLEIKYLVRKGKTCTEFCIKIMPFKIMYIKLIGEMPRKGQSFFLNMKRVISQSLLL